MNIHTSRKKYLFSLIALVALSRAPYASDFSAFDSGIKHALSVMKHEKGVSQKPIKKGYCISTPVSDDKSNFEAVKLEAYALYKGYPDPFYMEYTGKSGKTLRTLCIAFIEGNMKEAEILKKRILERTPKINKYHPNILKITNPGKYHRIVPGLGRWSEDKTESIMALTAKIESQRSTIRRLEKKIEDVTNFVRGISSSPGDTKDTKSHSTVFAQATKKNASVVNADQKTHKASQHQLKKPKKVVKPSKKIEAKAKAKAASLGKTKGFIVDGVSIKKGGGERTFFIER